MIALLAQAFVKATLILLAAGAATLLLRRASAALRHLVWALACAGVLVLPVGSAVLPAWDVPALPAMAMPAPVEPARSALEHTAESPLTPDPSDPSPAAVTNAALGREHRRSSLDWTVLLVPAWLAGGMIVLGALALGLARLAWLRRVAEPVRDERWLRLARGLARDVGLTRPVTLLRAAGPAMPMTWGLRHPVILLPADADAWPAERRRDVLLHELAHVARRDFLTQLVARAACAVYWFHPLVWLAAARLRVERERACDDQVLRAGARPSDYAGHLLEIARALRPAPATSLASVAMARPAQLGTRLLDVLDARRCRDAVSPRRAVPAWAAALAVVVPLAAAAPRVASTAGDDALRAPVLVAWAEPVVPRVAASSPLRAAADSLRGCSGGKRRGVSTSHNADDDVQTIMATVGQCTVTLNAEGDFAFSEDFTDFADVDGFVTIVVDYGRSDRRLTVRRSGGGLERVYKVDGDTRPFDAEAKAWLGETLTFLLRRTGHAAPERARWILERRGIQGLLDEIALLAGDYARRRYYQVALASGRMDAAAFERLVEDAGRTIQSDYELAELLIAVAKSQPLTERMQAGFVAAAKTLRSDYERRRVLQTALTAPGLTPAVQNGMLDAAAGIRSDYELAELLIRLHTARPIDDAVRPAFFRAANSLQSDYEHRRVLSAVIGASGRSRTMLLDVLGSAKGIASDYELAELLTDVAAAGPLDDTLRAAFFAAARTLNSDYEHGRTLISVAKGDNLSSATALAVIESARTLSSDHQRAEVLVAVIRSARVDGPLREAIEASVRPMRSQHDRGRVLDALSRRGGRAELD